MVSKYLKNIIPKINFESPIKLVKGYTTAHWGGLKAPKALKPYHEWIGFEKVPRKLFVVDDVLTKGAHFRLIKVTILEEHPKMRVIGIFWARAEYLV